MFTVNLFVIVIEVIYLTRMLPHESDLPDLGAADIFEDHHCRITFGLASDQPTAGRAADLYFI